MANADLIRRMHSTLDAYERGEISSIEVEDTMPCYVDGIEGLPYEKVHEVHKLCGRLVASRDTGDMDDIVDLEPVEVVLRDFRRFVDSLPTNA
jgi:hypothetical protein